MMRFSATYARACSLALAAVGLIGIAPASYGAVIGYDIVFVCDFGCTTGVDAPTGALFLDFSALQNDGAYMLEDFAGTMHVTARNETYNEADDVRDSFPAVVVENNQARYIDFFQTSAILMILSITTDGNWRLWSHFSLLEAGTYNLREKPSIAIPKPRAATPFTPSCVLISARLRQMARHRTV